MKAKYIECMLLNNEKYLIESLNNQLVWEGKARFEIIDEGDIFSLNIIPLCDLNLKAIRIIFEDEEIYEGDMLSNGYQTWSQTKYLNKDDKIKNLSFISKPFNLKNYGDYHFYKSSGQKGNIHSHELTCLKRIDGTCTIFASMNQEISYTIFEKNFSNERFSIYIDLEGLI